MVYELDYKKPILYVFPIQSILGKLLVVPVLSMDARCGSSTRGLCDGRGTCNES